MKNIVEAVEYLDRRIKEAQATADSGGTLSARNEAKRVTLPMLKEIRRALKS